MNSIFNDPRLKFSTGFILSLAVIVFAWMMTHGQSAIVQNITENPKILGVATPVLTRQAPPAGSERPIRISPPKLKQAPDLENISAKSFLVYDSATGRNLVNEEENLPLPVASLTKLLTAYTVYQQVNLRGTMIALPADQLDVSPNLDLQIGDEIILQDLFNAMLVGSANDAALALANYTARITGEKFIDLMNEQADRLGMDDSHFSNPLGFDSETNYSTAADIKRLVQATRQYPAFSLNARDTQYSFTSQEGNSYSVRATNKLVGADKEIYAVKTGFTDEAQGAMVTEIWHQGHSFVIIVLASTDREVDTLKLKSEIIKSFTWDN